MEMHIDKKVNFRQLLLWVFNRDGKNADNNLLLDPIDPRA